MVTSAMQAIDRLVSDGRLGAVVTIIDGPDIGSFAVIDGASGSREIDATWLDEPLMADVVALMAREESLAITHGDRRLFVDVVAPPPTMLIFGAGHVAQMLVPMAQSAGFRVVVSDARSDWITQERFPGIDGRVVGWPDRVLDTHPLDARTFIVLLSHDRRFEDPVFSAVRDAHVAYIGAMGSRRTHAGRLERLASEGWTPEQLGRIHGPIGLDLGAKTPAETAVSIMAEVILVRRTGG
jgi:xanthine dehydrogenase accessory factor